MLPCTADDPAVRLAALAAAARHYCAFLLRCRQYGLLSPPAEAAANVALKQAGQGGGGVSPPVDAATLRHNKIESFKRCVWGPHCACGVYWIGPSCTPPPRQARCA